MSLKAPVRSYESTDEHDWPIICCSLLDAEPTGIVPRRLRCSVWPLFPNKTRVSKRSRACPYTSHLVIVTAGYNMFTPRFNSKVQRGFNSSDRNAPKQAVSCKELSCSLCTSCTSHCLPAGCFTCCLFFQPRTPHRRGHSVHFAA